jgi:DNA polymerase-3 subunit delta'
MKIFGHKDNMQILEKMVNSGKINNGYIFSGKEGIGKYLVAKEFAKMILCSEDIYKSDCFCDECRYGEKHPDLIIIDLEIINSYLPEKEKKHSISIEIIRELKEFAEFTPFRSKHKVCIINDSHLMQKSAANAFLKTLEEPSVETVFILVTHKFEKLLPTIKSRCINIRFSGLTDEELKNCLYAKGYEDINDIIIKYSSGSVLKALNLMESMEKNTFFDKNLIENKMDLIKYVFSLKDKNEIRFLIANIYLFVTEIYKENKKLDLIFFGNYLLEIYKRLDYNVNLDIFKYDLISKLIGVLSEEI